MRKIEAQSVGGYFCVKTIFLLKFCSDDSLDMQIGSRGDRWTQDSSEEEEYKIK